jgi:hypothetical protein
VEVPRAALCGFYQACEPFGGDCLSVRAKKDLDRSGLIPVFLPGLQFLDLEARVTLRALSILLTNALGISVADFTVIIEDNTHFSLRKRGIV